MEELWTRPKITSFPWVIAGDFPESHDPSVRRVDHGIQQYTYVLNPSNMILLWKSVTLWGLRYFEGSPGLKWFFHNQSSCYCSVKLMVFLVQSEWKITSPTSIEDDTGFWTRQKKRASWKRKPAILPHNVTHSTAAVVTVSSVACVATSKRVPGCRFEITV